MSDDEFLTKFEQRLLNHADWTHEAHVRMAWLYVARSATYKAARSKVRSGIKKLNAAFEARSMAPCGTTPPAEPVAEVKSTGFHETITTAFVRLIAARVRPGEKYRAFRTRNADLFDRKLPALLTHYSKEVLFSDAAKTKFAQPDLEPLPKPWLAHA